MKKRMKQFGSLVMALAMVLSLSVTALADTGDTLPGTQTDSTSTIATEGPLPADLVDVVMPVATGGHFSMIFDSHGMLSETLADRFKTANYGKGVTDIDNSCFFFQNNTLTPLDKTDKLLADASGEGAPTAGTEVVKFTKVDTNGLVKIYAGKDADGKHKWVKDNSGAADVVAADWDTGGAYVKIAALQNLDPASGYGLDAIAKLNKDNPDLYLIKTDTDTTSMSGDLKGSVEYSFVASYSSTSTDTIYAVLKDAGTANETVDKVFSDLSATAATATPANLTDATNKTIDVKNATLTIDSDVYYRQRENKQILSLKKTSIPVQVINKTNGNIGVSMQAELTNLPGGTGQVVGEGAAAYQTYVYAKAMNTTTDADGNTEQHFYDGPIGEATTKEITGVPTLYMTLTAEDNTKALDNTATENVTTTEVLTYDTSDTTAPKGIVSVGTMIPGQPTFFEKKWTGTSPTDSNGKYVYQLKTDSVTYAKREADFHAMTFTFEGAIDSGDESWDTLATGTSAPAISVTWKVEACKDLKAPTVDKPTVASTRDTVFAVTNNTENAVLAKITQGGTEIATDKITVTNDATSGGTTSIKVAKGVITGKANLVFTFKDQTKDFRTVTVPVNYVAVNNG